jgi:pimeloyl-ACP methyl ester carboxylesterase
MSEFSQEILEIRGCKLFMQRGGSGEPVVFLHGANAPEGQLPFMKELAQRYEVFVPDHPGFGRSDTPDWIEHVGDMAYFYLDVLKKLDLTGVHLIGNSLGGWIAAEMAVRSTERLKSLTLVAAAGIYVEGVPRPDLFLLTPRELAAAIFADQEFAAKHAAPLSPEAEAVQTKNKFMTAKLTWQPRSHNPDLRKWLHRIDVPTLIVWGDSDQLIPPAYAKEYGRLIPSAELALIPKCGHLPQIEKAADFTGRFMKFAKAA